MKKNFIQFLAVIAGATLHHWLFWKTGFGLNTLIFAVITLSGLFLLHPDLSRSRPVLALTGGVILSALTVVVNNTIWSQMMYLVSFTLLLGVVQQRTLRFLWYAALLGLISWLAVPIRKTREYMASEERMVNWNALFRWMKILLIPLLLFSLFLIVYSQANLHLAKMLERLGQAFKWLPKIDWSPWQLFFFLFGLGIMSSLFWPDTHGFYFARGEKKWRLNLLRRRPGKTVQASLRHFTTLALRNEYWMGVLVIGMLNGLLLLVNLIDLRYIWIPQTDLSPQELSQFVHKGTSMLILAILMAMLVLLVFFRRNLNFFPDNKLLRNLSYAWIAQNGLLAFSVAMRNIHYIRHYGLTHLRLGVLLFLFLVCIGLLTLYIKIRFPKTIYYLLMVNAWAIYLTFMGVSILNWDVLITRYNLHFPPKTGIDYDYLIHSLSDKNLFLLDQHAKAKNKQKQLHYNYKEHKLEERLQRQSWKTWNWPDERNWRYLKK